MYQRKPGYIYEGATFVLEKSDIRNATDEQFIDAVAYLPSGWVSVKDELPKHSEFYNVCCNVRNIIGVFQDVRTYRFERIKGRQPRWIIPYGFDDVVSITHWQPLPAPPETEEEA